MTSLRALTGYVMLVFGGVTAFPLLAGGVAQQPTAPVPPSPAVAEAACARGNQSACGYLGGMLATGRGVLQDLPRGFKLLEQACTGGHAKSCENRDVLKARLAKAAPAQPAASPTPISNDREQCSRIFQSYLEFTKVASQENMRLAKVYQAEKQALSSSLVALSENTMKICRRGLADATKMKSLQCPGVMTNAVLGNLKNNVRTLEVSIGGSQNSECTVKADALMMR